MPAALPRKIPAGSRPESRRASMTPSAVSTENARWMASSIENSTASQNRPGRGLARGCGGRGRGRTRTGSGRAGRTAAAGSSVTLLRRSRRRSLPTTRAASRSMESAGRGGRQATGTSPAGVGRDGWPADGAGSSRVRPDTVPPATVTVRWATARARSSSWEANTHGGPGGDGIGHQAVDQVPAVLVQRGVGLVEQPQLGAGGPPGWPGRCGGAGRPRAWRRHVGQPAVEAEAGHGGVGVGPAGAAGPGPEAHVVGHGEVVVEAAGVAEQPHQVAGPGGGRPRRSTPEHRGLALDHRHQARAGAQHGGLAGTVRVLAGARSRRRPRRDRRRPERESDRADRPQRGI